MSNIKNPQNNPLKSSAPVRPPGGDTAPKKVYVCSPFRPTAVSQADRAEEQRSNIERALKACRILAMMGIQPLAPHLYFTRFLKDDVAAERDAGMRFALSWLEQADELWVFGERVSDGMAQEIAKAKELGKPVHTLPEPGRVAKLLIQSISQKYNMTENGQQDMYVVRLEELRCRLIFSSEDRAWERYNRLREKGQQATMPKVTSDESRMTLLDAIAWKYDWIQQNKKQCFRFAEAVYVRQMKGETSQSRFIEAFIQYAANLPEPNRRLLDEMYELAWYDIQLYPCSLEGKRLVKPWYDTKESDNGEC